MTLEQLTTIYCLGESHCLRYRDRLHRATGSDRWCHTRVRFLPDVEARNFTAEGGLHPDLAAALLGEGLCVERHRDDGSTEIEAAHAATTFADRVLAARHAALSDEPLIAPALLLFAGDKEVHSLAAQLGESTDFDIPDNPGYPRLATAERVPFETIEAALATRLQPFLAGIEALQTAGFTRTLVHGLMPRCRDDARVMRWLHGNRISATVRSKLALTANRLLASECRRLGVGFVDVWDILANDGYLDPRFDLDGIHGNHLATAASCERVVEQLAVSEAGTFHPAQYELLAELTSPANPVPTAVLAGFPTRGFAVHDRLAPPPDADAETLPTTLSTTLHAMQTAGEIFAPGPSLLSRGWPGTAAPAGVRSVLWLDRGSATLLCRPRDGATAARATAATPVHLEPGALLVFDPRTTSVVVTTTTADAAPRHLAVLPRLPHEVFRLFEVASPAWPADPFRIEVVGTRCQPPVPDGVLRRWREIEGRTLAAPSPAATN